MPANVWFSHAYEVQARSLSSPFLFAVQWNNLLCNRCFFYAFLPFFLESPSKTRKSLVCSGAVITSLLTFNALSQVLYIESQSYGSYQLAVAPEPCNGRFQTSSAPLPSRWRRNAFLFSPKEFFVLHWLPDVEGKTSTYHDSYQSHELPFHGYSLHICDQPTGAARFWWQIALASNRTVFKSLYRATKK